MRILLIEDNHDDACLIRKMLSESNGDAAALVCEKTLALGLERLVKERFDVLLLDLSLTDSRGLETVRKAHPIEQSLPTVALTGVDDIETAQKVLKSGAQDYLVKGKITADSLERSIRYAMWRHSADDALRVSEEHFRRLVENAGEVILTTDLDLNVTYVSPSVERQTGFTAEEVIGRDSREFITAGSLDTISGMLADQLARQGETDVVPPVPVMIEVEQRRKDGSTYPVEASAGFLRDPDGTPYGVIVVSRDITERKAEEEKLRRTSDYLERLLDSSSAPIIVWDAEFKVQRFNHGFEKLTGYAANEVVPGGLGILFPLETREESLGKIERTLSGESWESVEIPILRKDGDIRIALWNSATLYDKDGKTIIATIAQGQDITDRKAAEDALLDSKATLARRAQELKDLLAIAAHELRHPATVIKGYSHLLLENSDNLDSEAVTDALMSIDGAGDRIARIVNQLMDASRIEREEMLLRFEDIEPCTLLNRVASEFQGMGAEIVLTDKTEVGVVVKADRERLRAVLANLVENAIKFSPEGSLVDVCVEAMSGGFLFSVCDRGPGVSEGHAEMVFEPFYMVVDVEHHSVRGIGLGLYIAKTIIDGHGGWIRYLPREGGGSVFEFFVPEYAEVPVCEEREQEHDAAQSSPSCESRPLASARGNAERVKDNEAKRVLKVAVIDDDPDIVKVTRILLKSKGYETVAAHGGEEGLELVRREMPDVVLLDIMMPGLDGIEVCRRLKSDESTRGVPVIFVTARTSEECAEKAFSAGGSGFLEKPFEPDELSESIEKVCGAVLTRAL